MLDSLCTLVECSQVLLHIEDLWEAVKYLDALAIPHIN